MDNKAKKDLIADFMNIIDIMSNVANKMRGKKEPLYILHAKQLDSASNMIMNWIINISEDL